LSTLHTTRSHHITQQPLAVIQRLNMSRLLHMLILFGLWVAVVFCAMDIAMEYGEKAFKRCRAHGRKISKETCSRIQDIVEDHVDNIGSQLVALVDMPMAVAERNAKHPAFVRAGNQMIDEVIEVVLENPKATDDEIRGRLSHHFFKWWFDVLKNEPPIEYLANFKFPGGFNMPPRPRNFPQSPPPPPPTTTTTNPKPTEAENSSQDKK
jgi:hypothetical protein